MRPIVEVPLYIIIGTVGATIMVLVSLAFVFILHRVKKGEKSSKSFYAWMAILFLLVGGLGAYKWHGEATRKPTPAEARAWINEAEAKLKQGQLELKQATDRAHKVYEKYGK